MEIWRHVCGCQGCERRARQTFNAIAQVRLKPHASCRGADTALVFESGISSPTGTSHARPRGHCPQSSDMGIPCPSKRAFVSKRSRPVKDKSLPAYNNQEGFFI